MGGDTLSWDAFGNLFTDYGQTGGLRVSRRGNGYTVEIPTPGFKPDEIGVTLDDGQKVVQFVRQVGRYVPVGIGLAIFPAVFRAAGCQRRSRCFIC